ncbi:MULTISPECIES: hypothetical protein [unclassified Rhizobium]|nr:MULTISPECIES: hypothetical protein [unclassified Rhizobium]
MSSLNTRLRRPADLKEPVLDIVVLGARLEEQEALQKEFERHADQVATQQLEDRMKAALYDGLPVYAMKDLSSSSGGKTISVGVIECTDMGNVAAAINTAYAICEYRPSLIIFSGIAGALDSGNIRIGDVIFPRTIVTRDFNKLKSFEGEFDALEDSDKNESLSHLKAKLHSYQRTVSISERAKKVLTRIQSDTVNSELRNENIPAEWLREFAIPARAPHVIHEEAAFSWNAVLSNEPYVRFLKKHIGNAWTSVEMESYGFLSAVERVKNIFHTDGLVIRAISDFAQHKDLSRSDPKWRKLGLANMAIATRCVIERAFSRVY